MTDIEKLIERWRMDRVAGMTTGVGNVVIASGDALADALRALAAEKAKVEEIANCSTREALLACADVKALRAKLEKASNCLLNLVIAVDHKMETKPYLDEARTALEELK